MTTTHARSTARRALWGALGLALVSGLAGCPLQTPTFEAISPSLVVAASSGAPLVGDTITLTATAPLGGVDLSSATWKTSDATVVSLSAATGPQVMADALKVGSSRLTVTAGALHGTVTITVLGSVSNVAVTGPTSLVLGADATYTATVTDITGHVEAATVTWVANGSVSLAVPGANTGSAMRIHAMSVGPGAVTAQAGGRSAQVAVKVTATSGQLVIEQPDGTPVPTLLPYLGQLTVQAGYEVTNEAATDAQWTATGACAVVGGSGSTISVQETGLGACTLTASAKGMKASVTFTIVDVTSVKVEGDTSPLALGEVRRFTAVAVADQTELNSVTVDWAGMSSPVCDLKLMGNVATVTALGVGTCSFAASKAKASAPIDLQVDPSTIVLTTTNAHVLMGASTTVNAKALGPTGTAGPFTSADAVAITGATGFASVSAASLMGDGSLSFTLGGAKGDSAAVAATYRAIVSNALSFSLASIAGVVINGPQGPVRVGSTVDFTAAAVDAQGVHIAGDLVATWTDATGVYTFPQTDTLKVTGNVVKLGTSAIVATIAGVASPPFASPAQPGSIVLGGFTPFSIAVGAKATTFVQVLDAMGAPIPNVPVGQVSLAAGDATKVSFDAGIVMGVGFRFTATGLAATAGTPVTATWTDGMFPIDSGAVPLIVTGP